MGRCFGYTIKQLYKGLSGLKKFTLVRTSIMLLTCSACTSGQSAIQPPVKNAVDPIAQSALQFAVGTANIAGAVGLNTLAMLRQTVVPYVGTSVLTNSPTIVGPSNFIVPANPTPIVTPARTRSADHLSRASPLRRRLRRLIRRAVLQQSRRPTGSCLRLSLIRTLRPALRPLDCLFIRVPTPS